MENANCLSQQIVSVSVARDLGQYDHITNGRQAQAVLENTSSSLPARQVSR